MTFFPSAIRVLALLALCTPPLGAQQGLLSRTAREENRVMRDYLELRAKGLEQLNEQALASFKVLQEPLSKSGDLESLKRLKEEADKLAAELTYYQKTGPVWSGRMKSSFVLEVLVPGEDAVHVVREGFYLVNTAHGRIGQPGGADFPSYVNGEEWQPRWPEESHKSREPSQVYRLETIPELLQFELLAVGSQPHLDEVEEHEPVSIRYDEEEETLIVLIPETSATSKWYRMRFYIPDPTSAAPAFNPEGMESLAPAAAQAVTTYWNKRKEGIAKLNASLIQKLEATKGKFIEEQNLQEAERVVEKIQVYSGEVTVLEGLSLPSE